MSYPYSFKEKCGRENYIWSEDAIGEGNFSTIYKAWSKSDDAEVALKVFCKNTLKRLRKENDALMEKHVLQRLHHHNIVRLLDTFIDSNFCYVVAEYLHGGELWLECIRCGLPEPRVWYYFGQILEAVDYMHRMGIVHRDLKAENIFLTKDKRHVKLGDFGSARDLFNPSITGSGNSSSSASSQRVSYVHYVGTPNFMAPEAIGNKENDTLSDIWSLGCLLYQMLVGIAPFTAGSEYLIFLRVQNRDLLFPSSGLTDFSKRMVECILQLDRSKRPSVFSILERMLEDHVQIAVLPELLPADERIREIGRGLNGECDISVFEQSKDNYFSDRLDMLQTVIDWEKKSQPGAGTSIIDHLNLFPVK